MREMNPSSPFPFLYPVHVEIAQKCLRPDKVRELVGDPSGPDRTLSEVVDPGQRQSLVG